MDIQLTANDLKRFWSKIKPTKAGCWEWTGTLTSDKGKGIQLPSFAFGDKRVLAHRLAYYLAYGEQPDFVGFSCDTRGCMNPSHLTPVKGPRFTLPNKVFKTKPARKWVLKDETTIRKVLTLRRLKLSQPEISRRTGVNQADVCTILQMAAFCKRNKLKPYRGPKRAALVAA